MGSGKGLGLILRRLLILVSGWDLVMRVYFAVFLLLFHTSNYCIAFFLTCRFRCPLLFVSLLSDEYHLSNEVVVH